jgi:nitrite reductase/ring-hydroxylating ferredoxin subunit
MAEDENWFDICSLVEASQAPIRRIKAANMEFAVSVKEARVGVISNACNHVGGPLGEGRLDGGYIVCPWHNWKFHRCTGVGEPGFEGDCVPAYPVKVENGRVFVDLNAATKRKRTPHAPHPLARPIQRAPGPLRLAGIATTVMASFPTFIATRISWGLGRRSIGVSVNADLRNTVSTVERARVPSQCQ